jgi:hypothetical protein
MRAAPERGELATPFQVSNIGSAPPLDFIYRSGILCPCSTFRRETPVLCAHRAFGNRPFPRNTLRAAAEAWRSLPQPSPAGSPAYPSATLALGSTDCRTPALPAERPALERQARREVGVHEPWPASNVDGRTKPVSRPDCATGVTTRLDLQGASQFVHDGSNTVLMTHKIGSLEYGKSNPGRGERRESVR